MHGRGNDPDVGARLVAVKVNEIVDSLVFNRPLDGRHFRARAGRFLPVAVQVDAVGIGAQIPQRAAVRIGIGDHGNGCFGLQFRGDFVVRVQQPADQALGRPFGHRLAGMLARDDPDALAARLFAKHQHVQRAVLRAAADGTPFNAGRSGRHGQQGPPARFRVGNEEGVTGDCRGRVVAEFQHAAFIAGGQTLPVDVVRRSQHAVAGPGVRVTGLGGIADGKASILAGNTLRAKIEPLKRGRVAVRPDSERGRGPSNLVNDDVAAIEICRYFHELALHMHWRKA